jgi:hypothetical protein
VARRRLGIWERGSPRRGCGLRFHLWRGVLIDILWCGSEFVSADCGLTTVEVDQRLLCDLSLDIALVLGLLQLLDGGVV